MVLFTNKNKPLRRLVPALFLFSFIPVALAAVTTAPREPRVEPPVTQLIVKFKPAAGSSVMGVDASQQAYAMTANRLQALSAAAGIPLTHRRAMSGNAQVVKLPYAMSEQQAEVVVAQLKQSPDVEYAEPDRLMFPMATSTTPNDPYFVDGSEWHLLDPNTSGNAGAANVVNAWATTQGSASVVVAVVDTGVRGHADLVGNLSGGSSAASGYDMIDTASPANSGLPVSNDGDGRDADPTDPGDWETTDACYSGSGTSASSWHGTHVAGIIGAVGNNSTGVTGVNQAVTLLAVRALGVCGGYMSDIEDAVIWAAGGSVTGVPANATPAKVINMSLGGYGSCGPSMQATINFAVSQGATVVVAAGNSNDDVMNYSPASCSNVITVTALNRNGGRAYYSNYDMNANPPNYIAVAAPGGEQASYNDPNGILSTLNAGLTTAGSDNYIYYQGTSMAAPVVTGVVALMLAANPHLMDGSVAPGSVPGIIKSKLMATARAFPAGTGCTAAVCGAGIVDAAAAITAVTIPPVAVAGPDQQAVTNSAVYLNGGLSHDDGHVAAYHWVQTAGTPVILNGANTATPYFKAPATAQTLTFQLTAYDDVGLSSTSSLNIGVYVPTSSGGGGSLDWFGLGAMGALAAWRRRQRTR